LVRRAGLVLALIAIALLAYFFLRGDSETSAEAKYDGVHLCAPEQQDAATAVARAQGTPAPSEPNPEAAASRTEGPLFAQNSPAWGNEEYDHGAQQNIGCGQTIAQCGCAMTSVATILSVFGNVTLGNEALDPSSLNDWFNEGAQLTSNGWVSNGYSYGNVVWTAANNIGTAGTPESERGQTLRFAGWGPGDVDLIRRQLQAGNGVVVEVPGHYVAAVGLQTQTSSTDSSSSAKPVSLQEPAILINDPYYEDRTTLSAYAGLVKSIRIYEPGEDLSAVMITVPADQRVRVTDSEGNVVGTLGGDSPEDWQDESGQGINGAQTQFEEAWRDPTCTERPPEPGDGTNSIFIPGPEAGDYTVEVLNPTGDETSLAVYIYKPDGALRMLTNSGAGEQEFGFTVVEEETATTPPPEEEEPQDQDEPQDEDVDEPEEEEPAVEEPLQEVAGVTEEQPPADEPADEQPEEEPMVEAPPEEPAEEEEPETPIEEPEQNPAAIPILGALTYQLSALGMQGQQCHTDLSWTVKGDPGTKVELLRNNIVIQTKSLTGSGLAPQNMTYSDPFSLGNKSYRVRATNADGFLVESLPVSVTPFCLLNFTVASALFEIGEFDVETSYAYSWTIQGGAGGTVHIMERLANDGVLGPWTEVGVVSTSPSMFGHIAPDYTGCDPSQHQIQVTVNGVEVASPVRSLQGLQSAQCIGVASYDVQLDYDCDSTTVINASYLHTWDLDGNTSGATLTVWQSVFDGSVWGPYENIATVPATMTSFEQHPMDGRENFATRSYIEVTLNGSTESAIVELTGAVCII
jgi:hypothetical protein